VLRALGANYLRENLRKLCSLAALFETILLQDDRFELAVPTNLGLVCFRLKGANARSEQLHSLINADRRIHLVPATVHSTYCIRMSINSSMTTEEDIHYAYGVIAELAHKVKV